MTFLACIGYGAVFLVFGFFFRSPAIPALAVFGWELIHFLLPPLLKKISVIHYLQSLCPVPVSEGPLAMLSDAPSPWVAILGLLAPGPGAGGGLGVEDPGDGDQRTTRRRALKLACSLLFLGGEAADGSRRYSRRRTSCESLEQ